MNRITNHVRCIREKPHTNRRTEIAVMAVRQRHDN